jgi:NADPH-dependent glutamate synthase beta subunit-like oxidoreductase
MVEITKEGRVILKGVQDVPPTAISLATTRYNKTGIWRHQEPYYQNMTPPCTDGCPAKQDIVKQLELVYYKKYEQAVNLIREVNPFPAICGRVCPHFCEKKCSRQHFGGAIAIQKVERFLGDFSIQNRMHYLPINSKKGRVAIVGSGPAGLTCAFFLARQGYQVTVFEAFDVIGGLLRTGIPPFRLPRNILDEELKIVFEKLPVKFETKMRLGVNLKFEKLKEFDAAFIAIGRYKSRALGIENEDHPQALVGIDFLCNFHLGKKPKTGKRVIVVGGGATAFDCARVIKRFGKNILMIYRRTEKEMPAFEHDVAEAKDEKIRIRFLTTPNRLIIKGKKIVALECIKMRLGEPDASGRRRPIPIPNSEFRIKADTVVKALGEDAGVEFLKDRLKIGRWGIEKDKNFMTSEKGIFAGGDCAGGPGTVVDAILHGRLTAISIDKYISGSSQIKEHPVEARGGLREVVSYERINPFYIESQPRVSSRCVSPRKRVKNFVEVNFGFSEEEVLYEANRCISCGTCTQCDNCIILCADSAIKRVDKGNNYFFEVNYDYCKGCGVCAEECPRGVIYIRRL